MSNKYKIGLIGAGKIVENSHLPVLKNIDRISVEWVYDINTERSHLLSKMYDVPALTNISWQDALQQIDICLLTIPYGVRREYYNKASTLSKAVYVEKPFALSIREHAEISAMFQPYNLAVGFQRRCYSIVRQLSDIIESKIFGKLINIDFTQGYFTLKGGKGYLSDANLSGGGVIIESAIHSFDQILLFTKALDVTVDKVNYLQRRGIDYDSSIHSTLVSPDGNISVVTKISALQNLQNGLILTFENANIHCKLSADTDIKIFPVADKNQNMCIGNLVSSTTASQTVNHSFYTFWNDFIKGLDSKTVNYTSAASSLLTTKWMQSIYEQFD